MLSLGLKHRVFHLRTRFVDLDSHFNSTRALYVSVDESVPHSLIGDRARIEYVLGQLVDNAVKFSATGGSGNDCDAYLLNYLRTMLL